MSKIRISFILLCLTPLYLLALTGNARNKKHHILHVRSSSWLDNIINTSYDGVRAEAFLAPRIEMNPQDENSILDNSVQRGVQTELDSGTNSGADSANRSWNLEVKVGGNSGVKFPQLSDTATEKSVSEGSRNNSGNPEAKETEHLDENPKGNGTRGIALLKKDSRGFTIGLINFLPQDNSTLDKSDENTENSRMTLNSISDKDTPNNKSLPSMFNGLESVNMDQPKIDATDKSTGCYPDYCVLLTPCEINQMCVMTPPTCLTECLDSTQPVTSSHNPLQTQETTILRPEHERTCPHAPHYECIHGIPENCSSESFSCVCDEGWSGWFCDELCNLPCVHGQCVFSNNLMHCNCKHEYIGERCDQVKPDPEERSRILAAVLSVALTIAILLAVVIPVIMWRMRVILVLKLVYIFKEYEDEDGKTYDAYVSMTQTPNAENFVYRSLRPKLENSGFKLYLQARDAPVGEVMSENILAALENSRRTIMIVTSDYITNEWNRFEYLMAQHETLKMRQRIIPVILEDIEQERNNMDRSLKNILDSIRCLQYPHPKQNSATSDTADVNESLRNSEINMDIYSRAEFRIKKNYSTVSSSKEEKKYEKKLEKFWKRLELTMPKKKSLENPSTNPFMKLAESVSLDASSISQNCCDIETESKQYGEQIILEVNCNKNHKNNNLDDQKFDIKIIEVQKNEEQFLDSGC